LKTATEECCQEDCLTGRAKGQSYGYGAERQPHDPGFFESEDLAKNTLPDA
jgi:hypothetical protein